MVEGALNPAEIQEQTITQLQQEITYIRHERQVTMKRVIEIPHNEEEVALTPTYILKVCTLPMTAIYQQLTTNIPPFTTIMQYYHALRGLTC